MNRAILVRFELDDEQKALLVRYARRHYGHARIRQLLHEQGTSILYSAMDDESEREHEAEVKRKHRERNA